MAYLPERTVTAKLKRLRQSATNSVIAILLGLSAASSSVSAADPDLPKGVGPLPDPSKGARAGAIVTAEHAPLYHSLLPPELAKLNKQGEFVFEALRSPREPARFSFVPGETPALAPPSTHGELRIKDLKGLPRPLFISPQSVGGDVNQAAYKILWNTAALNWNYGYLSSAMSVLLFKAPDSEPKKIEFDIERVYPRKLGLEPGGLDPVFRERISANKPEAIRGLAWLTLRFFGAESDFVWASSPVINRIRQLTGSNRSDQIFTGAFSPDDLWVWSGKVELVEPTNLTLLPILVPVIESANLKPDKNSGCISYLYQGDNVNRLNYQTSRFKGAGSWVPTDITMVLRQVWRIELVTRDPFSLDTRQMLYIDRESGLPIYRVVWDQAGRQKKLVMGLMQSADGEGSHPEPKLAGQVVIPGNGTARMVMLYESLKLCAGFPDGKSISDFDPSLFVKSG
jgi:hypothetical protein